MPLTIGDLTIDKISGPISFTMLTPKLTEFEKFKLLDVRLPVQLFFGDAHKSTMYMCKNCHCKADGKGPCCVKIYSKNFLQAIDSLASTDFPVDIYVETFQPDKKIHLEVSDENDIEPLHALEAYSTCYDRTLRGTKRYERECPTQEIKWHYVDPRHEDTYNRMEFIESKIHYMYRENKLGIIFEKSTTPTKFLKELHAYYKEQFSNPEEFIFANHVNKLLFAFLFNRDAVDKFFNLFLNIPTTTYKSIIYKQMKKYPKSYLVPLIETLKAYVRFVGNPTRININKDHYQDVVDVFELMSNDLPTLLKGGKSAEAVAKKILAKSKKVPNFATEFRSIKTVIMDIYAILRMFKPIESNQAWLNVSYYGNAHSSNMIHFFTKIYPLYDATVVKKFEGIPNRCISTSFPDINLMDIGKKYGVKFLNKPKAVVPEVKIINDAKEEKDGKKPSKECEQWFANPLVNPRTKRTIQEGKKTYNDLVKECGSPEVGKKDKPVSGRTDKPTIAEKVEDWERVKKLKAECLPPEYRWIKGERRPGYCEKNKKLEAEVQIVDHAKPKANPKIEVIEIPVSPTPEKPTTKPISKPISKPEVVVLQPRQFPEYTVVGELGAGSYGRVNKIKTVDGKIYAEKIYFKDVDFNEVDTLFRLRHPNLLHGEAVFYQEEEKNYTVRRKIVHKTEGNLHLILPIAYSSLKSFSQSSEGRIYFQDDKNRLDFIYQLLSGLNFLHQNGIYHCDLKDDNVLVFKEGGKYNFKISDFGFTYGLETDIGICGSNLYSAPEYFVQRGKKIVITIPATVADKQYRDQRISDQFSMGMLIFKTFFVDYIMLSLVKNKRTIEVDKTIISKQLAELKSKTGDNFLRNVLDVVGKMMSFAPKDRFVSLEKAAESFGILSELTGGALIETFYPFDCNKKIPLRGGDVPFSQLLRKMVADTLSSYSKRDVLVYPLLLNTIEIVKRLAGRITTEDEFNSAFNTAINIAYNTLGFDHISSIHLLPVAREDMLKTVAELKGVIKSPILMDYAECEMEITKLFDMVAEGDKNCDFILNTSAKSQHEKLVGVCKSRSADIFKNKRTYFGKIVDLS